MPMPKIFTEIHGGLKTWSDNKRTEVIARGIPKGVIEYSEKWVQSSLIKPNGNSTSCFISGRFDTVANLDEGGYAVVDFKTAHRSESHLEIYARQLHAYAYALEHPAPGKLALSPVTSLGLLVFEPFVFQDAGKGKLAQIGNLEWIEIPRDDNSFMDFLSEVMEVLSSPTPPEPSPACGWCLYKQAS